MSLQQDREQADITDIMRRLQKVVDEAIGVRPPGAATGEREPYYISSEIIPPIFIASLGGGGLAVGLIGGISDGLPSLLKLLAGCWSDRLGKRKPLVVAGYALFAVTALGFAFVSSLAGLIALFAIYGLVYAIVDGS